MKTRKAHLFAYLLLISLSVVTMAPWVDLTLPDPTEYPAVPEGQYHVKVKQVHLWPDREEVEVWLLAMRIEGGPYTGRFLFDWFTFDGRGQKRIAMVLRNMGFSGDSVLVTQYNIIDREALATVRNSEYRGEEISRVAFNGWAPLP